MAQAYYGTHLSPNIIRLPNGSIVAKNAKLARTGWQDYTPEELKVHSSSPLVKVFRDPTDVFAPSAVSSANGATVTENHPPVFVDPQNWLVYARGVCQGAKRGATYEDGEYLVGDLLLTDGTLISKIEAGVRDISVGYTYKLICYECKLPIHSENGEPTCSCDNTDHFQQKDIVINHIAVVPSGRAGGAKIVDSAEQIEAISAVVLAQEEAKSGSVLATAMNAAVEKVRPTLKTFSWKTVMGLGLKEFAKDADPEALAEAMNPPEQKDSDPGPLERNVEFAENSEERTKERNKDSMKVAAKDEDKHVPGCRCADCAMDKPASAKDVKTLQDGIAEMMAELRAKKDKSTDRKFKARDEMPKDEDEEEMESEDSKWRKSVDERFRTHDALMHSVKDGLEELLKAKGGSEEEKKPPMPKAADAEESNTPPTEQETAPNKEVKEEENMTHSGTGEDDDVDIIEALPKEDRPENPIPGADAALAILRSQRPFVTNPANFANRQVHQQAIDAHNAAIRAIKGRGLTVNDGGRTSGPTYGDLNQTRQPEHLRGNDTAPKSMAEKGAEYEQMMREEGAKMRGKLIPASLKEGKVA